MSSVKTHFERDKKCLREFYFDYGPISLFAVGLIGIVCLSYWWSRDIPVDVFREYIIPILHGCLLLSAVVGAIVMQWHIEGIRARRKWQRALIWWAIMEVVMLIVEHFFGVSTLIYGVETISRGDFLMRDVMAVILLAYPLEVLFPKWRHVEAHIAPRYWFCQVFNRDFISFNAAYAHYNVAGGVYPIGWMYPQVKDYRYQGDAVMAGVSYGWHFPIAPYFSIELEAGVDAGYSWYDQFECKHCGKKKNTGGRWLVLPKLGVNLSFPLGGNEESLARRCDCELLDDTVGNAVEEEEEIIDRLPANGERIEGPKGGISVEPVLPFVPYFEPQVDQMQRLRNRLLRSAEEYEPYNTQMALSADPRNVFLYFDVNVTKMDRSFIRNDMLMDSIMTILGEAMEDSTIRISRIQIVGFASFDGRLASNERLAGSRAATIKEYMQSIYPLPDSTFTVCNGGESWAELQYQLEKIEFDGKEEVLAAIKHEPDLDKREALIKKLHGGDTYRYMRDELKHILRNLGCITIYYEDN